MTRRFKSAASALNYGFNKSTFPIVIFLHHDIILYDQATIDWVVGACETGNIAGFAGILPNGGELVSTISDGEDKEWTYDYDFHNQDWNIVLPYICNCIDHPDGKHTYTPEELQVSIDLLCQLVW